MTDQEPPIVAGWYGPPRAKRWHYVTSADNRSLCRKWWVPDWNEQLIAKAFGPANGDCAECKRQLAAST